jgi:putative ABC transport system permease protein
MNLLQLALRNAGRSKLRTALTVFGLALTVLAFVALRTVLDAWDLAARSSVDRLSTRNKISMVSPLPRRYVAQIEKVPGVHAVTHCDWFGARWPKQPKLFFANMACAANAFALYPEIVIAPAALTRFAQDRQAAIVGDVLAKQLGVRVGDSMQLESSLYPGDFRVHIVGIYTGAPRSPVDRATLFFRWDYKNDAMPTARRDLVDWIFTRVDERGRSAAVSRAVDALFDDADPRTLTMSERAANQASMGVMSAVLGALDVIALMLLTIMGLVLGNTMAMSVRERSSEHGVLRVLGFAPRTLVALVVGEALALGMSAGVFGLTLAYPIVELGMGRWLEQNMGKFFPTCRISPGTALAALGACVLTSLCAVLVPALLTARTRPVDALRRP